MGRGRNGNSKYDRFCSYKNPLAVYEILSRGCKVGVWCVVSALKVMETVFFIRNKFWPVTLIVKQLFRIFFKKVFLHKIPTIFVKKSLIFKNGHRCMSRNIFRRREFGLEAAGRHLRIFSEMKWDNRKNILNSLTQLYFVFKSYMFRSRYRS